VTLLRLTREHLRCKGNAALGFHTSTPLEPALDKSEGVVREVVEYFLADPTKVSSVMREQRSFGREVEDQDSGKLTLSHSLAGEARSTNHRLDC
jgi:hypothetical protein